MRKVNEIVSAGIAEKLSLTGGDGFHIHPPADETRNGFMTKEDRLFLNTIEEGAQKNQNAFSTVNNVSAKNPTDTLNVVGGIGITVSTNPTDNKMTITATGQATPGPHGISHNNDGPDPIPDLVAVTTQLADTVLKGELFVNVKDFGAKGDRLTDDSVAIQNAIDSIKPQLWDTILPPRGGIIYFPPGTYSVSKTINLPSYIRLFGASMFSTEIFLANGVNTDVIKTEGYDGFVGSGLTYYDTSGVPTGFGIENMTIRGNRFNNTSGSGLKIYGYNYTIHNVAIIECANTGFISRHETGGETATFVRNKVKLLESYITNLHVQNCGGDGINYYGPTDSKMDAVFVGTCYGTRGVYIASSCDVGLLHAYNCGDGQSTSHGVYIDASCRIDNLISEHNYGEGLRTNAWYIRIGNLQLYRNCRSNGSYNLNILNATRYLQIDNLECKIVDVNTSGIQISGKYNKITRALVTAEDSTVAYTGNGLRVDNTAEGSVVLEALIYGFAGTGGYGLRLNQGGSTPNFTFNGRIENCANGIQTGSQSAGGSILTATIILKTSSQISLPAALTPKATDRIHVVQQDSTGAWSTLKSQSAS